MVADGKLKDESLVDYLLLDRRKKDWTLGRRKVMIVRKKKSKMLEKYVTYIPEEPPVRLPSQRSLRSVPNPTKSVSQTDSPEDMDEIPMTFRRILRRG